jgi:hypothetical protein
MRPRTLCRGMLFVFMAFFGPVAAHELKVRPVDGVQPAADIVLVTDAQVQGLVVCMDWDGTRVSGSDLIPGDVLASGDLVVRRIDPAFLVLGVIMDDDGLENEVIPPGVHVLATARFGCASATAQVQVALTFRDGTYGAVKLGPLLDNMITVGGQSISAAEGLVLTGGQVSCRGARPGTLRIRDTVAPPGAGCQSADILLDAPSPVGGFVIAVAHDPQALELADITIDGTVTSASGADFSLPLIHPTGGTLEVILDLEPPFQGNTIPAGTSQVIARFEYCCLQEPPAGAPDAVTELRFVDGVLGDPPLSNRLVVEGEAMPPEDMIPGTFTCKAKEDTRPQEFRCGEGIDPDTGQPLPIIGFPGTTVKVCFFYRSLPDEAPPGADESQIQGLSMSVCFDPLHVTCLDGGLDTGGTIVEAVGAEFVNMHCESGADDGDGGELIVGILVDAIPPFDGQTLPPTSDLLKIGCASFSVSPDAPCDECIPIRFCDGANGKGGVPIRNLISVDNHSFPPAFFDCDICVKGTPNFQRGDCNWSGGALGVDLADPAVIIAHLFLTGDAWFDPPCLDACDANDDGRMDFADAVWILRFLFRAGTPPPAPGPVTPGPDPTEDRLDCQAGSLCP